MIITNRECCELCKHKHMCLSMMGTCQNPERKSNVEKIFAPPTREKIVSIRGTGKLSLTDFECKYLKSIQNDIYIPFALDMDKPGEDHRLALFLITLNSNIHVYRSLVSRVISCSSVPPEKLPTFRMISLKPSITCRKLRRNVSIPSLWNPITSFTIEFNPKIGIHSKITKHLAQPTYSAASSLNYPGLQ